MNSRVFEGKARSFQDFQLYFLRTLYNWSQVFGYATKLTLLEFVDMIIVESLRA